MSPTPIPSEALARPVLDTPAFRLAAFREAVSLSRANISARDPALECMAYFWAFETTELERALLSRLHPSAAALVLTGRLQPVVNLSTPVAAGSAGGNDIEPLAPSLCATRRAQRALKVFWSLSLHEGGDESQFLLEAPWIRAEPFASPLPACPLPAARRRNAQARNLGLLAFFSSLAAGGFLALAPGAAFAVAAGAALAYASVNSLLVARRRLADASRRLAAALSFVRQAYPADASLAALDPQDPGSFARAFDESRRNHGPLSDGEIHDATELDTFLRHQGSIAWPMRRLAAFEESQAIQNAIDSEIDEAPAMPPCLARRL